MRAIVLRQATRDDALALGACHVASWQETYAGVLPDEVLAGLSAETHAAMWRAFFDDPETFARSTVFVVQDAGRVIGFGACSEQRDRILAQADFSGEIGALYLRRSHQGRGLGRALMATMAHALLDLGHRAASLWVLTENTRRDALTKR